jgi:23S rRNA pseudouridine2605 synthase
MRLNRYIANAGVCSRRDADQLILAGAVSVNGNVVMEMGYRVKNTDTVRYGGNLLNHEKKVYLLLNKPKDFITTVDDEKGRKTVMDLVQNACKERIFPVGRLDRNTTGLLLFTNDGDLSLKLTHPKFSIKKIYHATLDKKVRNEDLQSLINGITLDDGFIKVDEAHHIQGEKTEVGIEISSGKNRIVRRMFEHLGYEVVKLDRVCFGTLTKKDLPRGHWRLLSAYEVDSLRML